MASKRQKKKQRKQKEIQRLNSKNLNIDENIETAKEELNKFEKEMEMNTEDKNFEFEKTKETVIKTDSDFENKLDDILSKSSEIENEDSIDDETKKKATTTAEKIAEEYKDTETFTMKDIIKLMKSTPGLSYKQIMQQMKEIGKATEEYAATQGDDFDRKEFLRKQMEQRLGKK